MFSMFARFIFASVLLFAFAVVPQVQAQSPDVSQMLARMQAIILQMEQLQTEFKQLSSQLGGTASPVVLGAQITTESAFTESLEYGETNDDIKKIQRLLATDPAIYPYGVASGFFGPKTEEAIKNLQARFGLKQVGVIGPATTALLSSYIRAYPNENYPDGVLTTKPTVLGVSTSNPSPTTPSTLTGPNPAKSINVQYDDGEALIEIQYTNGTRKGLIADTEKENEVVNYIVSKTSLTTAQVNAVIDFGRTSRSSSSGSDNDEEDAEDALDDAESAIDDAKDEIEEADDDGDDVDWAEDTLEDAEDMLDEAEEAYDDEDWDEAVELAEKAEDLAQKAIDRIGEEKGSRQGDNDEIESIDVDVDEDESDVTVEYEDGDEYEFTVDEDKVENIIEAIADELDMDEDDVEDLISFDFGDVDRIDARIDKDKGTTLAIVYYESGVERRVRINSTKQSKIIEEIADEIGEDEDDVTDWTDFD